jgi:predicted ATPase
LTNLGALLSTLDQPAEALILLREAKALFTGLKTADPYNEARATIALADGYLRAGELSRAEAAATDAALRMWKLGSAAEHAEALLLLGEIARRRSDPAAARDYYHTALDAFTAVGSARASHARGRLATLRDPAEDPNA